MWDVLNLKGLLLAFIVFAPLERLLAIHAGKKILRPAWKLDLFYALFNGLVIKGGLIAVIFAVTILAAWLIPDGFRTWVGALPIWVQFPAALFLADLGFYTVHRLFHAVPWLWKFHAVHHSIETLDWLAGHRVHPVDQILTKGASLVPLFAFGFSDSTLALFGAVYLWQSMLLHSNVDLRFGPLRWIIASPQFHHWHHADHPEAYDKNFAGQLSFLDLVFGTMHLPGQAHPEKYGTPEPVPQTYTGQLMYPVRGLVSSPKPEEIAINAPQRPAGG